eukprot:9104328-Pyramimonas_sp.AAC.2
MTSIGSQPGSKEGRERQFTPYGHGTRGISEELRNGCAPSPVTILLWKLHAWVHAKITHCSARQHAMLHCFHLIV